MLSSFFKARADTLPRGAKQWKFAVRQLWLLRQKWQILKMTLPQKNDHRIKTPSSKLMILVSCYWEKNSVHINAHNLFHFLPRFLEIIDRRCCILSGPPCIRNRHHVILYVIDYSTISESESDCGIHSNLPMYPTVPTRPLIVSPSGISTASPKSEILTWPEEKKIMVWRWSLVLVKKSQNQAANILYHFPILWKNISSAESQKGVNTDPDVSLRTRKALLT